MILTKMITGCAEEFNKKYGAHLQPLHRRALDAMLACRRQCGECFIHCEHCQEGRWVPLSCGHRACPQCQVNLGEHWCARQQQKLLPVAYFMVTFTLPAQLRGLMWRYQSFLYDLFFQAAATTLKTVGKNNHQLHIGMTGILHTHTRSLDYHPHIHFILPGGGLMKDKKHTAWKTIKNDYWVNEMALAQVFRGIFLKGLADQGLSIPTDVPKKWVVNIKAVGRGEKALQYLSRYLYRGVIAQNAIYLQPDHQVTYRYQHSKTKKMCYKTLGDVDFLGKLMQHILPKGFRRVRDYGFLHANAKKQLQQVQLLLRVKTPTPQQEKNPPRCANCQQPANVVLVMPKRIPFLFRGDVSCVTPLHFVSAISAVKFVPS